MKFSARARKTRRRGTFPEKSPSFSRSPRFPLQTPQPLFLLAKEAQKKKLRKKKSADGEISRSAERDKATRLDGAAFYKKAGEKFWKGHAIKPFKTLWEAPFFFVSRAFGRVV